jgi:uncharacterized protein YunC (DUF1805 family)
MSGCQFLKDDLLSQGYAKCGTLYVSCSCVSVQGMGEWHIIVQIRGVLPVDDMRSTLHDMNKCTHITVCDVK